MYGMENNNKSSLTTWMLKGSADLGVYIYVQGTITSTSER